MLLRRDDVVSTSVRRLVSVGFKAYQSLHVGFRFLLKFMTPWFNWYWYTAAPLYRGQIDRGNRYNAVDL